MTLGEIILAVRLVILAPQFVYWFWLRERKSGRCGLGCLRASRKRRIAMKNKAEKQLAANWDRLRTLVNVALRGIGLRPMPCKVTNDDGVETMALDWGISIVWPAMVAVKGQKRPVPGFAVQREIVIPGVRTFRNGDPGYPDDVDFEELKSFATNDLAAMVRFAVTSMAMARIEDYLNAFLEEEWETRWRRIGRRK